MSMISIKWRIIARRTAPEGWSSLHFKVRWNAGWRIYKATPSSPPSGEELFDGALEATTFILLDSIPSAGIRRFPRISLY